ncbi:hypothetical protein [Maribacter sp. R77961]|uniref:hypothetical protein n=1 Tax=Maribacter sp. R77961 TaxID=3093871 RepID=UPI0037CB32C5
MKYTKSLLFLLFGLVITACSSEKAEMNDAEKYVAEKFGAEWTSIGLSQTESKTNGKVTENRKFIDIVIKNSSDIDKIMKEQDYAEKRIKNVAQFVLDSVQFGEMSFTPEEIQIEFIKDSGFLIFNNETKQSMSFNLN